MLSIIDSQPAVINKACFRAKEDQGRTALDYAKEKGNQDIVDIIESYTNNKTALDYAKERGNQDIVDIIESYTNNKTALDYAKEKGDIKMLQMLREAREKE